MNFISNQNTIKMYPFCKTILTWTKYGLAAVILFCVSFNFFSCNSGGNSTSNVLGGWTQESSFDGGARYGAVLFTIADTVYICSGFNGNNSTRVFLKDLWGYDATVDTWKKREKAELNPGPVGRAGAVAFSANGKGYVGLGYNDSGYLKDFWSYDPATGLWTKVKDFPGNARRGAVAFTINNFGYVGTGTDDNLAYRDFYQYNALTNEWIQKASVPKVERANAFSFVIDGLGYVGGGANNGGAVQDLYAYDPQGGGGNGAWIQKNDLKDDSNDEDVNDKGYGSIGRESAVTFVIEGKGYVTSGKIGNSTVSETWEYDPSTDKWIKKQPFGFNVQGKTQNALTRFGGVGFSRNGYGYVVGGKSGGLYLNDKWQFDPAAINN